MLVFSCFYYTVDFLFFKFDGKMYNIATYTIRKLVRYGSGIRFLLLGSTLRRKSLKNNTMGSDNIESELRPSQELLNCGSSIFGNEYMKGKFGDVLCRATVALQSTGSQITSHT